MASAAVRSWAVALLLLTCCWLLLQLWDSVVVLFCCALLCVPFGFAIILVGRGAVCFAWFVFLVSCGCCVALPRGAVGFSAVCDCGIS